MMCWLHLLVWHLNQIQMVSTCIWMVRGCHNCHYQNNMCCRFEGFGIFAHVQVYVSLSSNNGTSNGKSILRYSSDNSLWFFFDLNRLTIHNVLNSAVRSTFKCPFGNWKTFWWLNKEHKINISALNRPVKWIRREIQPEISTKCEIKIFQL